MPGYCYVILLKNENAFFSNIQLMCLSMSPSVNALSSATRFTHKLFSKLRNEKKSVPGRCPSFRTGCPFEGFQTVGEFEEMLSEMCQ